LLMSNIYSIKGAGPGSPAGRMAGKDQTMPKLTGTINANYLITYERDGFFLGTKVVIANNPKAPDPWVCWDWSRRGGFSNGYYCGSEASALAKLADRVGYDEVFER